MTTAWSLRSRAKLNLSLRVTGKRADGYHMLESLFAYSDWSDHLTLVETEGQNQISCIVDGPCAPQDLDDANNLAVRAYHFALLRLGILPAVHMTLTKNIPAGAGLGGGSGNAAAIVRWAYGVKDTAIPLGDPDFIEAMRSALGADTYPILEGQARLWAGTGDDAGPILDPKQPLWVLVVFPKQFVSTGAIFGALKEFSPSLSPSPSPNDDLWQEALSGPNDLQSPATTASPGVASLLEGMKAACQTTGDANDDAIKVQMTGSGSACFTLFQTKERAREAAQHPELVLLPQHVGPLRTDAWAD